MDSNYFEIQLKKGEIDYSLQSLDDSLIIQAISQQQIKWETTLNNQNFRNNLKIDRDEIDWEQIKLIIEEIFKNNYKSSFSEDSNLNILKIECEDSNIKKKIGDLVIELKKTKNTLEKFKRIEEILLQMDSPLTRKILTKVKKLKNVFVENELVSYNLENENSSLKKQNQVFKQEIEKPKSSDQNEKIMEPKEEIINIQLEMLKVMKRQLDKLESIDFQIQQNKKLIEYQNSLKLQMKQEKMKMKNLKMMKIIGMENSCLPLREMFILKNFLREAGVLNEKSFLNLVYVASKHGYSASDFHKYSDHKPKNIILIKANDFIFGGYSPVAWGSKKGWVECKDCFIFSLSNPCNLPLKMNCKNPTKSIYDFTSFGPIFGGGSDIYISDNCNLNNNSYSDPGCSYDGCPFPFSTKESKTFFCGTANFKVQEIEVYQIFQIF